KECLFVYTTVMYQDDKWYQQLSEKGKTLLFEPQVKHLPAQYASIPALFQTILLCLWLVLQKTLVFHAFLLVLRFAYFCCIASNQIKNTLTPRQLRIVDAYSQAQTMSLPYTDAAESF